MFSLYVSASLALTKARMYKMFEFSVCVYASNEIKPSFIRTTQPLTLHFCLHSLCEITKEK